jgi:mono/diheme cytochrome c family protein
VRYELIATLLFFAVLAALFLTRRRLGIFLAVSAFFVATTAWLTFGFDPRIPVSARAIYMALLIVSTLLYITSSNAVRADFWAPIRRIIVEPKRTPVLAILMLGIPALVGWRTYAAALPTATPPPKIRSVHPSPPSTVSFQPPGATEAVTIDVIGGSSPFHALPADQYAEKVAHGKIVYYQNCFYCHGDTLEGNGHYVNGVKPPPPANFSDRTVIPNFTETFFFWRISKGGPGLPEEGTPYDSSMPVWEKYLSQDDIWSVIAFLGDQTGYQYRAASTGHAAEAGK